MLNEIIMLYVRHGEQSSKSQKMQCTIYFLHIKFNISTIKKASLPIHPVVTLQMLRIPSTEWNKFKYHLNLLTTISLHFILCE